MGKKNFGTFNQQGGLQGKCIRPTKRAVISVLAVLNNENVQLKPEKKEKMKIESFCNLWDEQFLMPNDNDVRDVFGYPAMVSRPLDFRTIDLRLAAGPLWRII
nr:methyl-CpG-binding domain-containing protein 9 [Ipomoea batatas]